MALKNRFELRMDDSMANDLESLATDLKTNQADVLRRALALYAEVKKEKNNTVILKNNKTQESTTLIGV